MTFRLEGGILYIEGTGRLKSHANWKEYIDQIKQVVIAPGCTTIGSYVFSGCNSLTSITIPEGVTVIGKGAFENIPHIIYHGPAQSDNNWGAKSRN